MTALCPTCGSEARQPGSHGVVLHRFVLGERVRSAKMAGTVVAGPVRNNGYKIAWDNGYSGWSRVPGLDHMTWSVEVYEVPSGRFLYRMGRLVASETIEAERRAISATRRTRIVEAP